MKGSLSEGNYLYWVASEAANRGAYKEALSYLTQVLATSPKHALAWHVRGDCLDNLGRYEEALRCYDTALSLDPGNAETWFNKGVTLKKLERQREAESCMETGVRLALGD